MKQDRLKNSQRMKCPMRNLIMRGMLRAGFAAGIVLSSVITPALGENRSDLPEDSQEKSREMIALRMESLSRSLNGIPKPPELDQTLQIPREDTQEDHQ